jgi:hypothetical protein
MTECHDINLNIVRMDRPCSVQLTGQRQQSHLSSEVKTTTRQFIDTISNTLAL